MNLAGPVEVLTRLGIFGPSTSVRIGRRLALAFFLNAKEWGGITALSAI